MGLKNWFGKNQDKEIQEKSVNPYIDSILNKQGHSFAGVDVTYSSAMRQADVYTCVRIISESIGMIPMKVYRDRGGVLEEVSRTTREHKIFCQQPNAYMTSQEMIEHLTSVLLLRGHAFLEVKRNNLGSVMEVFPMRYLDTVNLSQDTAGIPFAKWVTRAGQSKTSYPPFHEDDLFDVKLQTLDGYRGISPISMMAEQIGTGIATQRHTAKIFENGTRLSGILSTDDTLDTEAIERIAESWNGAYGGTDNAGKVAILEGGLQYTNITMTNQDAQLLELLGFSREQIAAAYRVPAHMLNSPDSQTMSNLEHNNRHFLTHTLMPTIVKLENALGKLLPDNMSIKFDTRQFVRGDFKTQAEVVETLIKNRVISHEESREMFDLAPANPEHTFVIQSNNYVWGTEADAERNTDLQFQAAEAGIEATRNPKEEKPEEEEEENDAKE